MVVAFNVYRDLVISLKQQVIGVELFVFNDFAQILVAVFADVAD